MNVSLNVLIFRCIILSFYMYIYAYFRALIQSLHLTLSILLLPSLNRLVDLSCMKQ